MRQFVALLVAFAILAGGSVMAASPAAVAAPAKKATGSDIVATAQQYRGTPYKYGGTSPKGFDCSGFVWYVYNQHGQNLPRTADKQFEVGAPVKMSDLKPGDIVFFTTTEKGPSHCGIFVGQGRFIHASSSRGVMVSGLADQYWKPRYLGARRLL